MINGKSFFNLALIYIVLLCSAYGTEDYKWILKKDSNKLSVWSDELSSAKLTKTVKEAVDTSEINEQFFKDLKDKKRKILASFGISLWESNNYNLQKNGEEYKLVFDGTYVDIKNQKIYFREVHLYQEKQTTQFLFTQLSSQKVPKNLTNEIIESFK